MKRFAIEYTTPPTGYIGPRTRSDNDVRAESIVNLRKNLIQRYNGIATKISVWEVKKNSTRIYSADGRRVIYSGDSVLFLGQLIFKDTPKGQEVIWFSDKGAIDYYVEKSTGKLKGRV